MPLDHLDPAVESGLVSRYLCSEPSACAAAPGAPGSAFALDAASGASGASGATGAVFGAAGSQGSRETDAGQDLVLHFTELGWSQKGRIFIEMWVFMSVYWVLWSVFCI